MRVEILNCSIYKSGYRNLSTGVKYKRMPFLSNGQLVWNIKGRHYSQGLIALSLIYVHYYYIYYLNTSHLPLRAKSGNYSFISFTSNAIKFDSQFPQLILDSF